ncbi:MAG: TetR/AcrR family transcriptional regulator [Planctomycetia bacterium]|nr:TetR/AcrR family transcriptional regulator [Planctomycetia bacterium]
MGKRHDEAQRTRQKLIDAIKALKKEKEYRDIRIEEITEKAAVAKGTFYVYFKRKEDLIAAAAYDRFDVFKQESLEERGGIETRIGSFLQKSAEFIEDDSLDMAQQWLRSGVAPLEEDSLVSEKLQYDLGVIEEYIRHAIAASVLCKSTPIEELALQIVSQYYGTLCLWCVSCGKISMKQLIGTFCSQHLAKLFEEYRQTNDKKDGRKRRKAE